MKCRWADIFLDWLCCTDWGLFCVLDSKQVDIYGLCIQFCSWYIKLHSTKLWSRDGLRKTLKKSVSNFYWDVLRCHQFVFQSTKDGSKPALELKSKYVTTKAAANSFNLEFLCPKSRKIKTKKFLKMSLENNNHCLNINCICWEGHNSTLTEM